VTRRSIFVISPTCDFNTYKYRLSTTNSSNVNSRVITPMPFFHRSYNDHIASSCLKVATALLLLSLRIVVRLMSRYQELYLRCVQGGPNKKLCYRRRTAQRAVSVKILSIRYDTRCYFNVRSKANMSQLNLPHGTKN